MKTSKQEAEELAEKTARLIYRYTLTDALSPNVKILIEEATKVILTELNLESLIEDGKIVDHIQSHPEISLRYHKKRWSFIGFTNYEYDTFETVRQAISTAMQGKK